MARFVDECNHSRVRANIDVSHLVPADTSPIVSIQLEYSPDPAHIVEWVEEAYRETARLMDLSGLRG
jgi:hypothetical protein